MLLRANGPNKSSMPESGGNLGVAGSLVSILDRGGKTKKILYNKALSRHLTKTLLPSLQLDLANQRAAKDAYAQRLAASTPEAERISGLRTGYLERGLADTENFDAFNSLYRPLGDYLFGKMNEVAPAAVGLTKGADDARRIGLGIRPGGYSSYVDAARTRDIGDVLSRNFSDVLRTIGTDTSRLLASRAGERATGLGMLDVLSAEPDRLAARELLPAYAAQEFQGGDIEAAQNLINAYRSNVAGFKNVPSLARRVAEGLGGVNSSLWEAAGNAASIYSSMYGGGAGGGGGMGQMGQGNLAQSLASRGQMMPTASSQGGGGIDAQTLMSLFQMLQGTQSQQGFNPWLRPATVPQQYPAGSMPVSNWGVLTPQQQFEYNQALSNANAWSLANPGPWE